MRFSSVSILLLFFAFPVFSQENKLTVTGCVFFWNSPLEGVTITIDKLPVQDPTGINGAFSFQIPNKPVILEFSHPVFKTKKILIEKSRLRNYATNGMFSLGDVNMQVNPKALKRLEAKAFRATKVYISRAMPLYGYELNGENMVLTFFWVRKQRCFVRELNSNGQVLRQIVTKRGYEDLYKDFLGNLHLMSKDSIYQISPDFKASKAYPMDQFQNSLKKCIIDTKNYLYLQEFSEFSQKVTYTKVDKQSGSQEIFAEVFDKEQAEYNQNFLYAEIMHQYPPATYLGFSQFSNTETNTELNPDEIWKPGYFAFTLCRPTCQPLKRINENLYLFDHLEGMLIKYDLDGNQLTEIPIDYQKQTGWANKIIVNEEKNRCFAKFIENSIVTLREIDLETGKIKNSFPIEGHIYPYQISVRSNEIYYLYLDKNRRSCLWKQTFGN